MVILGLAGGSHFVSYFREIHGYLDFNRRAELHPIVASDDSLEDITQKVAVSFRSKWHMASEVRYENKLPLYLDSVFPQSRPTLKTIAAASSRGK